MENQKNELWKEDIELFNSMVGNYISNEEKNFFLQMKFKEEFEPSLANDLILSESNNSDNIYIVRSLYDEYIIGKAGQEAKEQHVMNLSEALNLKLITIGEDSGNPEKTLWQWLRERNYKGIEYDHNFDLLKNGK